jgi:hypothetical protein
MEDLGVPSKKIMPRSVFDALDPLDRQSMGADGQPAPRRSLTVTLSQKEILELFSREDCELIQHRLYVLSGYSQFVGQDFGMQVELNQPGQGWHWDVIQNIVRVDPVDLMSKPLEYLRGVFIHEGAHRRISHFAFANKELMGYPSFALLVNALEDPRINNFAIDCYPTSQPQLDMLYQTSIDAEQIATAKAEEHIGFKPKSFQAGFEFIRLWYQERCGNPLDIEPSLPEDVKQFVSKTLESAREFWWTYPSPEEIQTDPSSVDRYAQQSFSIIVNKIWPEFKKLVDDDLTHQEFIEMLNKWNSAGQEIPVTFASELSDEELEALLNAMSACNAPSSGGMSGGILVIDKLPPALAKKLKELMDKLSGEEKKELNESAKDALDEVIKEANKLLDSTESVEDKTSEDSPSIKPKSKAQSQPGLPKEQKGNTIPQNVEIEKPVPTTSVPNPKLEAIRKALDVSTGKYETVRASIAGTINKLENELRAIFIERKKTKWLSGNKWGQKLNIPLRIKEIARGVSAADSKIFMRRLAPKKQDYAITLLVDLSGSMRGSKIQEAFKASIMLSEVFSRLGIKFEILGFNSHFHEYKTFNDKLDSKVRDVLGGMLQETQTSRAGYNDDGWALGKAAERLLRASASERFLIVISDGQPAPSVTHSGEEFELSKVISRLMIAKKFKLVGLGIGEGTGHVSEYYPNSISDIEIEKLPRSLAELLRTIITDGDKFS